MRAASLLKGADSKVKEGLPRCSAANLPNLVFAASFFGEQNVNLEHLQGESGLRVITKKLKLIDRIKIFRHTIFTTVYNLWFIVDAGKSLFLHELSRIFKITTQKNFPAPNFYSFPLHS